jgi:hypothetical protein
MAVRLRYLAPLLAAGTGVAVVVAPTAAALPECTNTAPTTTQCERNGNVQINTSPNVLVNTGPFLEEPWLFGIFGGIGLGGIVQRGGGHR